MTLSLAGIILQSTILKGLEENKEPTGLFEAMRYSFKLFINIADISFTSQKINFILYSIYFESSILYIEFNKLTEFPLSKFYYQNH